MASKAETLTAAAPAGVQQEREQIFDIFRRWGYLQASLDPLGQFLPPEPFPIPHVPEGDIAAEARRYYCGNFAIEFMHIPSLEQRQWLQEQIEQPTPKPDQHHILTQLIRADLFEQTIQQRYLGTKRFSLEGLTVLIPFLDQVFATASAAGVTRSILAMAHRGRLNVMTNTIGRSPSEIFAKFEDVDPRTVLGGGDVKYHMGATGDYTSPNGKTVALHLASNPSHLEAVNPVVMGRARAWQIRMGEQGNEQGKQQVLPIILHGDAAFAGQGITAESLNMASLAGYAIGGTMHIITNNLLGFTANPEESNSTRFATDLAKRLPIPIFHVNGEDPDTAMRIAAIATEYRQRFHSDVVVDLIGYRRYGHNEADDPTVTQPRRYAAIKQRPFLYQLYAKSIGVDPTAESKTIQEKFLADQTAATKAKRPKLSKLPDYWKPYHGGKLEEADAKLTTGISPERVLELSRLSNSYPAGFHIHPKVQKLYEQRIEMGEGKRPFDYGAAELLAYASLLTKGTPVRLAGQDSQRGTFNQRHSVLVDMETEVRYAPLDHMTDEQARFEVHNSFLSEAACLGFEYGYARDYPEALVLWEAQFGDFVNGAQSIIDQFIAAGEAKWGLLSGVVMLLPHGYDGQGPEHSSARMERFLQLAANDNIVIAQPSNACQYFHLLRRQALRSWRKPLVVFTPKSMLRHPDALSTIAELGKPAFENVLPDNDVKDPRRLLVCSGKIGHNLRVERAKRQDFSVGIIFIEQLYPWPEAELQAALDQHPNAEEIIWVQEEPANMGAFTYVMPELRRMAGDRAVLSVKRHESASPATGSAKAHEIEEKTLVDLAFGSAV
ncbi:MAG TPA: 2-oxoglutarate dehydrogenase E1 component [Edaphobacter sp.]|jgi:2-oxoglutarate dehydrogenase E1 component|nr:2-oxoglutarate dehydrogenase E1 component [Edaphobacter sp.]